MDVVIDHLNNGAVIAGMGRLQTLLADVRRTLAPSEWRQYAQTALLTHRLRDLLHSDPFTFRAFSKPRGYAGDAVMMDYIYGYRLSDVTAAPPLARRIFDFTTRTASPEAVRFRRRVLAQLIDTVAAEQAREVNVTAIAAGHLREVDLSMAVRSEQAIVTAFDQDEESMAVVRRDYGQFGVQALPASVRDILARRTRLPACDLAYTAGLYDYLPDSAATRLTTMMFQSLRPGGTLLLANFLPNILDAGYMESYMDWHLIYRDDAQMRALMSAVPVGDIASLELFHDPFDNIVFLQATKRAR